MRKKIRLLALSVALAGLFVILLPAGAQSSPSGEKENSLELELLGSMSPLVARIDLPEMDPGLQAGIGGAISLRLRIDPFGLKHTDLLRAPEVNALGNLALVGDLELSTTGLSQSAIMHDGQLYRAWQNLGLGAIVGLSWGAFNVPLLKMQMTVSLSVGAALHVSNYTGTNLVSAYPSVLVRASFDTKANKKENWSAFIPLEYAFKGGSSVLIFGLGFSCRWRLL